MSIDNILGAMGAETKGRFESIRNQHYNPNVKGGGYEMSDGVKSLFLVFLGHEKATRPFTPRPTSCRMGAGAKCAGLRTLQPDA